MTLAEIGTTLKEIYAAVKGGNELAAKVVSLENELSSEQAKVKELTAQLGTLQESVKTSELSAASEKADKEKVISELKAVTAAKEAAEAKAKELAENPSAVALQIAAKAGVKPEERPTAKTEDKPKLKGFAAVQAQIAAELSKNK